MGRRLLWVGLLLLGVGFSARPQVAGPEELGQCDQGRYTITVANGSSTRSACRIVITNTVPGEGYRYVPGSSVLTLHDGSTYSVEPDNGFTWDLDALVGDDYELPPASELHVSFDLSTDCRAVSGTDRVTIQYEDCDQPGTTLENTEAISIAILPGALTITKLPSVLEAGVGDQVTWTLTVESTGFGPVRNVEIEDVLGDGLAVVSASSGGQGTGQTVTWNPFELPSLSYLAPGDAVSVEVIVEVVGCEDLVNTADARWGCGGGVVCGDTSAPQPGGTTSATAAVSLLARVPYLEFSIPDLAIDYCGQDVRITIPITNSGDGAARNLRLCGELPGLDVGGLPPGVSYDGSCFRIPEVAAQTTYELAFDVSYTGDWCGSGPAGEVLLELDYDDVCGLPHRAAPQFGTVSATGRPRISVTKSGPESLRPGQTAAYDISARYDGLLACGDGSTPPQAVVVDSYPEGFVLVDAGGGTHDVAARTVSWPFDPMSSLDFDARIELRAPTACEYCAGPGGGTEPNVVTVVGSDCCGCDLRAEASSSTPILCEGFDLVEVFSSEMVVAPNTLVRCGPTTEIAVTHTYRFEDDAALDDLELADVLYFFEGGAVFSYVPGTAMVSGATIGQIDDATPSGRLEIALADAVSVRGRTIIYSYSLQVAGLDASGCQAASLPAYAGIELLPGATNAGFCTTMYGNEAAPPTVTIEPAAMSVALGGIPRIQEECGVYPVTITVRRTSDAATPHDVRVVLTDEGGGAVFDVSGVSCAGVSPSDGTACAAPEIDEGRLVWRFADGFATGDEAQIIVPVTVPCDGPPIALRADVFYDDACTDDDTYDDTCSQTSRASGSLLLEGNLALMLRPETVYATERETGWQFCVKNTFNSTVRDIYVDGLLGSGLRYVSSTSNPTAGVTVTPDRDHTGAIVNGATWTIAELAPGERVTVEVTASLIGCDDLTNTLVAGWGCGGQACQPSLVDSNLVVVPGSALVATAFVPVPVDVCQPSRAVVTARNAGVTTAYALDALVTLPEGTLYAGNPEYRIDGGAWLPAGEPLGVPGPDLRWTDAEIPAISSLAAKRRLEVRFDLGIECGFRGEQMAFQVGYETPCGDRLASNVGRFHLSARVPDVSVSMRQVPDDAVACGGSATWEIRVRNDGPVAAPFVRVKSTLDVGWRYRISAPAGSNVGQITSWDVIALEPGGSVLLTLTADSALGGVDCEALGHVVEVSWACDATDADCLRFAADSAFLLATRTPAVELQASLLPEAVEACADATLFELVVRNESATAQATSLDASVTLPDGMSYVPGTTYIDCGGGYPGSPAPDPTVQGQTLTWYDADATGAPNDACEVLPPGGELRVRFEASSSCYFETRAASIEVRYYDCCGTTQRGRTGSVSIASKLPVLRITKEPSEILLDCAAPGDTVTWTVTVTNTGEGTADWIRVSDALGTALVLDASDSPSSGPGVPIGSNAIGWELGPLGPDQQFTATVTAHLVSPGDDCTAERRTNTVQAWWGCGPFDGDPNTTDETLCGPGTVIEAASRVLVPNLAIAPADIDLVFNCVDDAISPGSGGIRVTLRNSGDGPVTQDVPISVTEATTGFAVNTTFVTLGGDLPLGSGERQSLVITGWPVTCAECDYDVRVSVDPLDTLCECDESDNVARVATTVTLPDLVVDSAELDAGCESDGRMRLQGTITLRNDGCGEPLTGNVRLRLRVFEGADCSGEQLDTFTRRFDNLSIPANGGTVTRSLNIVRSIDPCALCEVSIRIEVDDDNRICECSGTNNNLCMGPLRIAFPDLAPTDVDPSGITCIEDGIAGSVQVTVVNSGCGPAGAFAVRLETDGCLGFADATVPGLAAGASTTVSFPVIGDWADCGACGCEFTATVDPQRAVCECSNGNNARTISYGSSIPDLEISGAIAAIDCVEDGLVEITAEVTVANTGCGEVSAPFDLRVTLYEGPDCAGSVVDSWIETIDASPLSAGGSRIVFVTARSISASLCAGGCVYSARFELDVGEEICECNGSDNAFCLSAIASSTPDLVITAIDPFVDCVSETARVDVTVENTGCGDAEGVVIELRSVACGLVLGSDPIAVPRGTSRVVEFTYSPICSTWNCAYTATADDVGTVCECSGVNSLAFGPYPGLGAIGDRIWYDADRDGVQDPGEDGIPGVTVTLAGDLDGDGSVDYTAQVGTDANGEYLFEGLPAGDYTVTVDPGTLPAGVEETYDFDGLGTPNTSDYALGAGEDERGQDFGYVGTGSIGDRVWYDANGDGVQDPGEDGIPGVTVTLTGDVDGDGVLETLTTETDADGEYLFEGLPAGDYTVTVDPGTLPPGLAQSGDPDGILDGRSTVTLGPGEDNLDQDFGYSAPALSVDKTIVDVFRDGASTGSAGPVEPGDVIRYRFVVRNVGGATAYGVELRDAIPAGTEIETEAPGSAGTYAITEPAAGGTLGLIDGALGFTTAIGATMAPGAELAAEYEVRVTSGITQGVDLLNEASATGEAVDGSVIPGENPRLGDVQDDDAEDPDADDTGTASVGTAQPALSVDKTIVDVLRGGASVGPSGPVEPGDLVLYRFLIRNLGGGTAYDVEFSDTLPAGVEIETGAPGDAGRYSVTGPATSGSLGLTDGGTVVATAIDAVISGSATLTAEFYAVVTSGIQQGVPLVNAATATGFDGAGTRIPAANPDLGDDADDDVEDPDADDTGLASVGTARPALAVDKQIVDVVRAGTSIGVVDPVLYGDILVYRVTVRNTGAGTAYNLDLRETLPSGLEVETSPPGQPGSFSVTAPVASGSLALTDGVSAFDTSIAATLDGGASLTAEYTVLVGPTAPPGVDLVNMVTATAEDGYGGAIPPEDPAIGDIADDDAEDPDADDTGIATVRVGAPALVTEKSVVRIVRQGRVIEGDHVEAGDLVTYRLAVVNVGTAPALGVRVTDRLPAPFLYQGPSQAEWPAGSSSLDPAGRPGPELDWPLGATLQPSETLRVEFSARVSAALVQGTSYLNVLEASGVDAVGAPIPQDQSGLVPADGDPDDQDDAVLLGATPALVTEKRIENVVRGGEALGPQALVQSGDTVVYSLRVANVGDGTAYGVDVVDQLPSPFAYVPNSTTATWPDRLPPYRVEPSGAPAPTLVWAAGATLGPDEVLVLQFEARVGNDVTGGATYVNELLATGNDGADQPIPADNRGAVPQDVDLDDRDQVELQGAGPIAALVTAKSVAEILRDGRPVAGAPRIEVGDVVRFDVAVTNVGAGNAYDVVIGDLLPEAFDYLEGSSRVEWPGGLRFVDPGQVGQRLTWDLGVTLAFGEAVEGTFEVEVVGPIYDEQGYVNVLDASGVEEDGSAILADRSSRVPGDVDPDDSSEVVLLGRSPFILGEGGLVLVPVLRKQAEILPAERCEAARAVVDRLWFQTDIAMYAAAEYERLRLLDGGCALLPETLLPTWLRTVVVQGESLALDNLLQVNVLSGVGVPLEQGPRVREAAAASGRSTEAELQRRLSAFAQVAGLDDADRPQGERWIVLEYAGGDPRYSRRAEEALGSSGDWMEIDERIVASALGMGLLKQVEEARQLARSDVAVDRYLALVLVESMANKVVALDAWLTSYDGALAPYVPHVHRVADPAGAVYEIEDGDSHLLDQLSLLWGLAGFGDLLGESTDGWLQGRIELPARLLDTTLGLLEKVLGTIERHHRDAGGRFLGAVTADGKAIAACRTVDLGLLVAALADAERWSGDGRLHDRLESLLRDAAYLLRDRLMQDGRAVEAPGADEGRWDLTSQAATIRGLAAAFGRLGSGDLLDAAQQAYRGMTHELWTEDLGCGLFASDRTDAGWGYCYTPLEVGLVVGALRELALRVDEIEAAEMIRRMGSFSRAVVDDAALQLSNILVGDRLSVGAGRGTILGLGRAALDAPLGLAPVLQQRLCLDSQPSPSVCGELSVEADDPWFQTDISMYASYIVQRETPALEDYADANLAAVFLHSGLGVPFYEVDRLLPLGILLDGLPMQWNPVGVPYAGGDPELQDADGLAWNPAGFDARILSSALGMTLLRASQEAVQLLGCPLDEREVWAYRNLLLGAAMETVRALYESLVPGPQGGDYVPHALRRTPTGWRSAETSVRLFDQVAVLWGASEAYALLRDSRTASSFEPLREQVSDVLLLARRLVGVVLDTLEDVLLEVTAAGAVLVDRADAVATGWGRVSQVSAANLGLAASALEHVVSVLGPSASESARARLLLDALGQYVRDELWDGSGGHREMLLVGNGDAQDVPCRPQRLAAQMAAIRVLLAAHAVSGTEGALDRALAAFRAIEARHWSPMSAMYRSVVEGQVWCTSPLELGLLLDTATRVAEALEPAEAAALGDRLNRHADTVLDSAQLQLPCVRWIASPDVQVPEEALQRFAPVFDREVCLRRWQAFAELGAVAPGDVVAYSITVGNPVDVPFRDLLLVDTLPDGVSYVGSDPEGAVDGQEIRWAFDVLEPGRENTWRILVEVDSSAESDTELVNCATLSYTDADGAPGLEREACASVSVSTAESGGLAREDLPNVRYLTDEAMALAWVLDDAGTRWEGRWVDAELARALSLANLGALLGESALGIPLSAASAFAAAEDGQLAAAEALARWAEESALPTTPWLGAPILVPFVSGTPLLTRGIGFSERDAVISPASVGQTLVREAQFLGNASADGGGIQGFLARFVEFALEEQLRWVAEHLREGPQGGHYLPRRIEAQGSGDGIAFASLDLRSLVYEESALLLGLLRVSSVEDDALRTHALEMASPLFQHLRNHWASSQQRLLETLGESGAAREALWQDAWVFVEAVAAARDELTEDRLEALSLLRAVAERAGSAGPVEDVAEEAARLRLMLRVGELRDDKTLLRLADDGVAGWAERFIDSSGAVQAVSSTARAGWTETPRHLAVIMQLLLAAAERYPTEAGRWLAAASSILNHEIVAARVQLADPEALWMDRIHVPCQGLAPVFAVHRGLPQWTNAP